MERETDAPGDTGRLTGTRRPRTAILISGRGSNMAALIEAAARDDYPAEIVLVVSNRPTAAGLDTARAAGLATEVLDHRTVPDRDAFDAGLDAILRRHDIDLVCLAGFMRLLTPVFTERWEGRMINIHPSLLPAFKGLDVHRRVIEAGVRVTGCTVHLVTAEMDAGPILAQAAVAVQDDDTPETLAARVLQAEHRCYPHALALYAAGILRLDPSDGCTRMVSRPTTGDTARSDGRPDPEILLSPMP